VGSASLGEVHSIESHPLCFAAVGTPLLIINAIAGRCCTLHVEHSARPRTCVSGGIGELGRVFRSGWFKRLEAVRPVTTPLFGVVVELCPRLAYSSQDNLTVPLRRRDVVYAHVLDDRSMT
jgi:hypothetical protein